MEDLNLNVIPVLIGADQNCYNVARAFHEAYGLVSHAMGRYAIGITQHTSIVKFHRVENLNQDDTVHAGDGGLCAPSTATRR